MLVAMAMLVVAIDNLREADSPPDITLDFGPKEIQENNRLLISQARIWSPPQDTDRYNNGVTHDTAVAIIDFLSSHPIGMQREYIDSPGAPMPRLMGIMNAYRRITQDEKSVPNPQIILASIKNLTPDSGVASLIQVLVGMHIIHIYADSLPTLYRSASIDEIDHSIRILKDIDSSLATFDVRESKFCRNAPIRHGFFYKEARKAGKFFMKQPSWIHGFLIIVTTYLSCSYCTWVVKSAKVEDIEMSQRNAISRAFLAVYLERKYFYDTLRMATVKTPFLRILYKHNETLSIYYNYFDKLSELSIEPFYKIQENMDSTLESLRSRSEDGGWLNIQLPRLGLAVTKMNISSSRISACRIALAVMYYERKHKHYPSRLDVLTPTPLDIIPKDPLTGGDFVYAPDSGTIVLPLFAFKGGSEARPVRFR